MPDPSYHDFVRGEIDKLPQDCAWVAVVVGLFVWLLSVGGY